MENFRPLTPEQNQSYPPQYPESGRGVLILILGIISLACSGPLTGIPAWIMGNTDLKKIKQNKISPTEQGNTKAGKILGIIGTFLSTAFFVFGIAVVVGLNLFQASAVDANRNAVIADLHNIGAVAQQYYKKPASLGGGGNTFNGFSIPTGLTQNANGEFSVSVYAQKVYITGLGKERGDDGSRLVHVAIVTPTEITISKQN